MLPKMSGADEFGAFFDNDRRQRILQGVVSGYYGSQMDRSVVFDTNRSWTGKASLTQAVYPGSKIICCVREVGWVIDSIEKMLRQNPLQTSRVFSFKTGSSVYARVETLMNSESGLIGLPWSCMREAWFSENAKHLIIVKYEALTKNPEATLAGLYAALDEPAYKHDFNKVVYDAPDYDADLGMPGLHKVRERVEFVERAPCIPPDIFASYADSNFWLRPELNRRGATIL